MLHPQTTPSNSAGNTSHFLGVRVDQRLRAEGQRPVNQVRSIDFASGAAMMLRASAIRQVGLFDDMLLRLPRGRRAGLEAAAVRLGDPFVPWRWSGTSTTSRKNLRFYYYLERNRWWLLGVYYKLATLLLLAPALLVMEMDRSALPPSTACLPEKWAELQLLPRIAAASPAWRRPGGWPQRRRTRRRSAVHAGLSPAVSTSPRSTAGCSRRIANPLFQRLLAGRRRLMFWRPARCGGPPTSTEPSGRGCRAGWVIGASASAAGPGAASNGARPGGPPSHRAPGSRRSALMNGLELRIAVVHDNVHVARRHVGRQRPRRPRRPGAG